MSTSPNPLKIVHLTSVHPAFDARIFQRECRTLAAMGYDVVVIVPGEQDTRADGVQIRCLRLPEGRLLRMLLGAGRVFRHALRENAALYQFHDPELIPVGLLLRMFGKQVVYDVHEDLPRTINNKTYLPPWCRAPLRWITEWIEKVACRHFSALVVATPEIAGRFRKITPRVTVVANFPDLKFLGLNPPAWASRQLAVAYVGCITEARGIRELLNALALLPTETSIRLVLAGKFWPESLLEECARLPGWQRVQYLGQLPATEIPRVLANVRAGIVTLLPSPNYISSMPIKMFEYMAAGLPVIASDFPLWREIIAGDECGLLVDPTDSSQLARAIATLVSEPDVAENMGMQGRAAVEAKYSWASQASQLQELYRKLLPHTFTPVMHRKCASGSAVVSQ
jgi:glycosyltransferase involved in cell wall biosynthesis